MIKGELKSKIDAVWSDFWSGGISNPLEVMEQLTYLLFIKGLDEQQTLKENKANRTGQPVEDPIFSEGETFTPKGLAAGRPCEDLRWSRFKNSSAQDMYDVVDTYVFPFLEARAADSTHARHMQDARLTIPTPALLQKAVDGLDAIPMEDRDTKAHKYAAAGLKRYWIIDPEGPKAIVYELRQGVFVETARHLPGTKATLDAGPAEIMIDPAELPA